MKDVAFGQFYPAQSVVHRLDPRTKLLWMVLFIASVFVAGTPPGYAVVAGMVLGVILLSCVPLLRALRAVRGVLFLMLFTALLNLFFNHSGRVLWSWWRLSITTGGVSFALETALRLSLLAMGAAMLTFTTTPMALTDGLESLLSPLKKLLPVHEIALIMSITLRFIPILSEEANKIMMAQKARGAALDGGNLIKKVKAMLPVLIPLFISAFRRAEELSEAMDARCYNATPNRTKWKQLHFAWRDLAAALVGAAYLVLIIALDHGFWGVFAPIGWIS